jgi:excisionase family DNA binding protein
MNRVSTKKDILTSQILTTGIEEEEYPVDLLSVKEISEILKVTRQQVRNWINTGKLKSIKLSERGTRIKRADFDDFLKIRKV